MTDYILVRDLKIPPGFTNEHRHSTPAAIKARVGKQYAGQPWKVTAVRPNIATIYDGETIIAVAEAWLMSGDFSDEIWNDDVEMARDIEARLADYLGMPAQALKDKTSCTSMSHIEVLQMLKDDAAFWSE